MIGAQDTVHFDVVNVANIAFRAVWPTQYQGLQNNIYNRHQDEYIGRGWKHILQ